MSNPTAGQASEVIDVFDSPQRSDYSVQRSQKQQREQLEACQDVVASWRLTSTENNINAEFVNKMDNYLLTVVELLT